MKRSAKVFKSIINVAVKNSANSTSSGIMFQPQAPKAMKELKK